jgi:hypothetical protein
MIPTITSASPASVFTGGQLITITGTNFQTKYVIDPATPHPWPTPSPTVSVLVGGLPVRKVVSVTDTTITCRTGPRDPGVANVTVQNLNLDGTPIPGEVVTKTAAVTFARVDLAVESDLSTIVDALVNELRRQVIKNVSTTTAVDFASDPDAVQFAGVDRASLPALCLTGPNSVRDRFYDTTPDFQGQDDQGYFKRVTAETEDLVFQLLILDNHGGRSFNLVDLTTQFFKNNIYLYVPIDSTNLSLGTVRYELESTPFASTSVNNINDLKSFIATVTVKGYQFVDVAGRPGQSILERTAAVDDIVLHQTEMPTVNDR